MKELHTWSLHNQMTIISLLCVVALLLFLRFEDLRVSWLLNGNNLSILALWPTPDFICRNHATSSPEVPDVSSLVANAQEDVQIWTQVGRVAWLQGNCDEALRAWRKAVALKPRNPIAKLLFANSLYANGRIDAAIHNYREIGAARYLYKIARQYTGVIMVEDVNSIYELSLAIEPLPDTAKALAANYRSLHQQDKANTILIQLRDMTDEGSPDYWWAVGYVNEIRDEWQVAKDAYKRGSINAADRYPFYWRIAQICRRENEFECARQYFQLASQDKPLRIHPLLALGDLEREQGNYTSAIEYYQKADIVFPPSELPEYYQGVTYWEIGDRPMAAELFNTAYNQNTHNADVLYALARVEFELGDYSNYEKTLNRLSDISWQRVMQLGDWHLKRGDCEAARAVYVHMQVSTENADQLKEKTKHIAELCPE